MYASCVEFYINDKHYQRYICECICANEYSCQRQTRIVVVMRKKRLFNETFYRFRRITKHLTTTCLLINICFAVPSFVA